jgi:hypothetical protein
VEVLVAVEVVGTVQDVHNRATIPAVQLQAVKAKTSAAVTEVAEVAVVVAIWVAQVAALDLEISVEFQDQMVQIWYLQVEAVLQPVLVPLLSYKVLGNAIVSNVRDSNPVLVDLWNILQ